MFHNIVFQFHTNAKLRHYQYAHQMKITLHLTNHRIHQAKNYLFRNVGNDDHRRHRPHHPNHRHRAHSHNQLQAGLEPRLSRVSYAYTPDPKWSRLELFVCSCVLLGVVLSAQAGRGAFNWYG